MTNKALNAIHKMIYYIQRHDDINKALEMTDILYKELGHDKASAVMDLLRAHFDKED